MTAIIVPDAELWTWRDRALMVLVGIAEDTDQDTEQRGYAAVSVLEDIRLHMDRATEKEMRDQDERIAYMEQTAAELRTLMAKKR